MGHRCHQAYILPIPSAYLVSAHASFLRPLRSINRFSRNRLPTLGVRRWGSASPCTVSCSLTEPLPGLGAGEQDETLTLEPEHCDLLTGTKTFAVKLPIDAYLEESSEGVVFIDEIDPDGNAANEGLLREGDVIVAVAFPYTDNLCPVPKSEGLDMVESFIMDRRKDEKYVTMAIASGPGLEELRSGGGTVTISDFSHDEVLELRSEIFSKEFPRVPLDEEEDELPDFDAMRDYGFDV